MTWLAELLVRVIVGVIGHEEARKMVSDEAKRRANVQADAVAKARQRPHPRH